MSKIRMNMMAMMRRIMLSCNDATMLSTKANIDSIRLLERINLGMHLAACKHCRKFYKQSAIITKTALSFGRETTNGNVVYHRMSDVNKSKLQRLLNNKIQSS